MNTTSLHLDRKLLESFRTHYEQDGYRFLVEPARHLLPDFLQGFHPDAIALSNGGGVVIEVKRFKQPADRSRILSNLAKEVARHPGWKLDIVYSTPFHPLGGWLLPSHEEIQARLASARREISNLEEGRNTVGDAAVQLLILWPIFEATARRRLIDENASTGRSILNPKAVIEALVDEGLISDDDASKVVDLMQLRDFASAGFREPAVGIGHVRQLSDLTEKLLPANQRPAA